jgi:hypothetical protein
MGSSLDRALLELAGGVAAHQRGQRRLETQDLFDGRADRRSPTRSTTNQEFQQ